MKSEAMNVSMIIIFPSFRYGRAPPIGDFIRDPRMASPQDGEDCTFKSLRGRRNGPQLEPGQSPILREREREQENLLTLWLVGGRPPLLFLSHSSHTPLSPLLSLYGQAPPLPVMSSAAWRKTRGVLGFWRPVLWGRRAESFSSTPHPSIIAPVSASLHLSSAFSSSLWGKEKRHFPRTRFSVLTSLFSSFLVL